MNDTVANDIKDYEFVQLEIQDFKQEDIMSIRRSAFGKKIQCSNFCN